MTDEQIIEWCEEVGVLCGAVGWISVEDMRAFASLVRNATLEEAAAKADATVCDIHLSTGVRIYGRAVGGAIRSMKE